MDQQSADSWGYQHQFKK